MLQMGMWVSVVHGGISAQSIFQLSAPPAPPLAALPSLDPFLNMRGCKSVQLQVMPPPPQHDLNYLSIHREQKSVSCRGDYVALELAAVSG